MTYHHSWLYLLTLTYDHHLELWLMTYDLWLVTYEYDYHLCLWPSPITSDYHLPLITITHVLSITITYHIWALLMTIIYDYHPWLLHMSITHDHHLWLWSYYSWLCSSPMNITYGHHLWTSGLMPYALHLMTHLLWVSNKTVTHDYHPWLCSPLLTMTITHEHDYHPWTWLLPMTMNITHNLSPLMTSSHHSWSITSPMASSHHSWLSPLCVTYDCHRCLITRVDHFSPMTLITQDHHSWPSPKTITNDHDYHLPLMTMTSYFWLTPMSSLLCFVSHVYDLWLMTITHHLWLSHPTIIHDYDSWPSGLITWLLTHDFSPMAIKVFSPMTMTIIGGFPSHDYHPWGWHTTYDHDFSPMITTTNDHEVSSTTIRTLTHDHQNGHRCLLWVSLVVSSHGLFDGWVWCPPWQTPSLWLTHPLW